MLPRSLIDRAQSCFGKEVLIVPTLRRGNACGDALRHATLERCGLNSHAGGQALPDSQAEPDLHELHRLPNSGKHLCITMSAGAWELVVKFYRHFVVDRLKPL